MKTGRRGLVEPERLRVCEVFFKRRGRDFLAVIREGIPRPALLVTSSDYRAKYTVGHTHTHTQYPFLPFLCLLKIKIKG